MDKIFNEDVETFAKSFDFACLQGRKVLVTGATGLIGKLLTNVFLKSDVEVIALCRDKEKAEQIFPNSKGLKLLVQDINTPIEYVGEIDYIIHAASVTASKDFVQKPIETISTTLKGIENVLEFAKEKNIKSMVYLSSLEVYGVSGFEEKLVTENDFGYLNPLEVRSSYSESKRMAECICSAYNKEFGVPVKIARLAQTFGAGVDYNDERIFAHFCRSVLENKDIVLHTTGETSRNYCYTTDAGRAILTILLKGENAQAYNVANSEIYLSIKDMAQILINKNPQIALKYEIEAIEKYGFNPTLKINLDTSKLKKLGWQANVGIVEMFERTILSMRH